MNSEAWISLLETRGETWRSSFGTRKTFKFFRKTHLFFESWVGVQSDWEAVLSDSYSAEIKKKICKTDPFLN